MEKDKFTQQLKHNESSVPSRTTSMKKYIHIGFWATKPGDPSGLPHPKDLVDNEWDPSERESVASYLDSGETVNSYRGFSFCRFGCGCFAMGSRDLTDGTYLYPEGYSHYLREHGVKPPQEFIDHALKNIK